MFPHLYHNDNFALFEANSNSRSCCVLGCFVRSDDFQQLHFVNGGEVVHPNHLGRRESSGLRNTLCCTAKYWKKKKSQMPSHRLYYIPFQWEDSSPFSSAFPRKQQHTSHSSCFSEDLDMMITGSRARLNPLLMVWQQNLLTYLGISAELSPQVKHRHCDIQVLSDLTWESRTCLGGAPSGA